MSPACTAVTTPVKSMPSQTLEETENALDVSEKFRKLPEKIEKMTKKSESNQKASFVPFETINS